MNLKKHIKTVFLPKTEFPALPKSTERARLDSQLAAAGDFSGFYRWQHAFRSGDEAQKKFVLLDGPPYANGDVHVGHAINKLMKDFIVKSRIQMGYRVDYRPGWDCHGLPIELKIKREGSRTGEEEEGGTEGEEALWVRRNSRRIAQASIQSQMSSFIRWGCTADFQRPYETMSPQYVSGQLDLFADFHRKGLVRRTMRPIHWSPSSRTALAESELEYNPEHRSRAVYFRFRLINFDLGHLEWRNVAPASSHPSNDRSALLYLLVWTTTSWTIPMNDAIAANPSIKYAAIEFPAETRAKSLRNVYIVAEPLLPELEKKFGREAQVLGTISGAALAGGEFFYKNAMYNDLAQPILAANFVKADTGTGLVHLAYAHGMDDFQVGSQRDDNTVQCFVDERGRYTRDMGHELEGKEVLGQGTSTALDLLRKNVLLEEEHVHAYPYDWRNQQPVIIRTCLQWFLDLKPLNPRCLAALEGNQPEIRVSTGQDDLRPAFLRFFSSRQLWCISRQRSWGVPIPAIRHVPSGQVLTNEHFVRAYAQLVRSRQDTDLWWRMGLGELARLEGFPHSGKLEEVEKHTEIMDVWMDSGVAWHTLDSSSPADVVVEGSDQFRGWFQSSLLSSMAARGKVPFRRILVHGMAVDEQGKKMSKSRGNVLVPEALTDGTLKNEPIGADGLRFWAAWLGSETSGEVRIGPSTLEDVQLRIKRIRLILRFILGALQRAEELKRATGRSTAELWPPSGEEPLPPLRTLDRWLLASLEQFSGQVRLLQEQFRFALLVESFFQFTQKQVSSYITSLRDRLYCAPINSAPHDAALLTLDLLGRTLIRSIAPILPHLAVEFFLHHPSLKQAPAEAFKEAFQGRHCPLGQPQVQSAIGDRQELGQLMDLVEQGRRRMGQLRRREQEEAALGHGEKRKEKGIGEFGVLVRGRGRAQMDLLRSVHSGEDEFHSDLVELLGTSFVRLAQGTEEGGEGGEGLHVELLDARGEGLAVCGRCRKRNSLGKGELCRRCEQADGPMRRALETEAEGRQAGEAAAASAASPA